MSYIRNGQYKFEKWLAPFNILPIEFCLCSYGTMYIDRSVQCTLTKEELNMYD